MPDCELGEEAVIVEGIGFKLVVEGLSSCWTNRQLAELFAPFGTVLAAHIVLPALGPSSGFGYVYMENERTKQR